MIMYFLRIFHDMQFNLEKCMPLLSILLISSLDFIFNFLFSFFNMDTLIFFHLMQQLDLNSFHLKLS